MRRRARADSLTALSRELKSQYEAGGHRSRPLHTDFRWQQPTPPWTRLACGPITTPGPCGYPSGRPGRSKDRRTEIDKHDIGDVIARELRFRVQEGRMSAGASSIS